MSPRSCPRGAPSLRRPARAAFVLALALGACSAPPPAAPAQPAADAAMPPPTAAASAIAPAPTATATPAPSPSAAPAVAPAPIVAPAPEPPAVKLGAFTLALAGRFVSLAVGEKRVAALGDDPVMLEGRAWSPRPLPPRFRARAGERDEARVYFGRDDLPRLMGARLGPSGEAPIYLRYRGSAWKEDRKEIGSLLDKPERGLYGVLGHADPEVVCKVGASCIIKRRSGA